MAYCYGTEKMVRERFLDCPSGSKQRFYIYNTLKEGWVRKISSTTKVIQMQYFEERNLP